MAVYEQAHSVQFPLGPRVFPTLVLVARDSPSSFITIQVPVNLDNVSAAKYSNGTHRTSGKNAQEKKKAVIGRYVSVERCRKVEEEGKSAVQWDMATASDAAGQLPMSMQKMAMTGDLNRAKQQARTRTISFVQHSIKNKPFTYWLTTSASILFFPTATTMAIRLLKNQTCRSED